MTTCPNCGAENKPDSTACRMCATPLIGSPSSNELPCPACSAMNEVGWVFCLQCGAKLPPPLAAEPPARPVSAFEPQPLEEPPKRTPSRPTAVESDPSPAFEPPQPPVSEPPKPPAPVFEPPQPPATPPPAPAPPPQPAASERKPIPPTGETPQSAVTIANAPGVACPQCQNQNDPESAFCYSCGASLKPQQAQTRVMSSIPAPKSGRLHLIMEGGQTGEVFDLKEETMIGRTGGDISFSHDGFMSSKHAKISRRGGKFILTDEGSRNGTFLRIDGEVELKSGDMILIGKQVFRFEA